MFYDIITIGSATRDVFAKSKGFDIHQAKHVITGREQCVPLGSKVEIQELVFDTGGGATNTAVSFANLGMKTAVICRVGKDAAGEEVIKAMKEAGVDTRFVSFDQKEQTAYSIILLTPQGERTILVARGASQNLNSSSIPWSDLKSQWLYLSSLGGNFNLLQRLLKVAEKRKIKVAWNPGGQEIKMGFKKLEPLIKKVEVLMMNEEETFILFRSSSLSYPNLNKYLHLLRFLPKQAIAITQGPKGALAADKKEVLFAPALDFKPVNTTGAGDAFSAGFIAGLWKWNNLSLALRLGILNSNNVVRKMGAKNGLLKRMPSERTLKKIKVKNLLI
jgi:sugar/nucleoside kinase (ribokinase family)